MAWLAATPKPPDGTKRAKYAGNAKPRSRHDAMKKDGIEPPMPPNPMPHFIKWFVELGITQSSGGGPAPLGWGEIEAWQRQTLVHLRPWEARLMRNLSLAYLAESRRAEEESCPPPWRWEVTQRERDVESAKLRAMLG